VAQYRIPHDVVAAALDALREELEVLESELEASRRSRAIDAWSSGTSRTGRHHGPHRGDRGDGHAGVHRRGRGDEQAAAQPAAAAAEDERFAKLTRLGQLKAAGVLTDEQLAAEKAELLGS
jgi:hypothetical protein